MNREEMKKTVLDYINKNDSVSYAELTHLFEENGYDYEGDLMSCSDQCEHVVFWSGWNGDTYDMLTELMHEGKIHREPTIFLTYLIDGGALSLPIVKRSINYKTDHWLPIVFCKGPERREGKKHGNTGKNRK